MRYTFDSKRFATAVSNKRLEKNVTITVKTPRGSRTETRPQGLRGVAKDVGTSATTMSRVERGFLPDLETFTKVCGWLGKNPASFFIAKP